MPRWRWPLSWACRAPTWWVRQLPPGPRPHPGLHMHALQAAGAACPAHGGPCGAHLCPQYTSPCTHTHTHASLSLTSLPAVLLLLPRQYVGTLFNLAKAEQQLGRQERSQELLREVARRARGVAGGGWGRAG